LKPKESAQNEVGGGIFISKQKHEGSDRDGGEEFLDKEQLDPDGKNRKELIQGR